MTDQTPEQVIQQAILDSYVLELDQFGDDRRELTAAIASALRAAGLLLGPDKVAVDREALAILTDLIREKLLREPLPNMHRSVTLWREDLDVITDAVAALSEPQPKPEGTS